MRFSGIENTIVNLSHIIKISKDLIGGKYYFRFYLSNETYVYKQCEEGETLGDIHAWIDEEVSGNI